MGKQFNYDTAPSGPEPRYEYNPTCTCNGCYLPAGNITSRWGKDAGRREGAPKEGMCRFHIAAPTYQWPQLTHNLRKIRTLIEVLDKIERLSPLDQADLVPQMVPGFPETAPEPSEKIFAWMTRVKGIIDSTARSGLPNDRPESKREAKPTMDSFIVGLIHRT